MAELTNLAGAEPDVAFSFLAQDEALENELSTLLQGKLRTFVYSEHQIELAGQDGPTVFGKMYGAAARLVVVLYRAGYGDTKWTRVERDAITGRGVELGWQTVLLVSLDGA